ncbi:ParB-like nuclease domain protein (plasmid) [Mycobacterium intracellulare subsp. chimaera]|uniref:ParB-like nuclease domain protein n=2 Tax=Mycobacterium intracellulare TaxID=1767 RepID=A0A7U5RZL0_MYCIT|nr:ParB-like nuclease domain protein [Mycobacterium intracellulare subsp. chimaera]
MLVSRLRGHLSVRSRGLDHSHVKMLAECSDLLPPIVVHSGSMRVIDGLHRLRAAELRGRDQIDVALFDGTEEEAFALSALLNVRQGLPLPLQDRKAAAVKILRSSAGWSDRVVASVVGLSPRSIASIRQCSTGDSRQLDHRIGRDGKARPVDPVAGRLRAARLLAENPELSLRPLARAAEISISTARDVRLRLRNGDDPVPTRLRRSLNISSLGSPENKSNTGPWTRPGEHRGAEDETVSVVPEVREPVEGDLPRVENRTVSFDLSLERLKRDPAVRSNEAGRNLVRQLVAARLVVKYCQQVLPFAPPHCLGTVADLAQIQVEAWQQLAASADASAETKRAL